MKKWGYVTFHLAVSVAMLLFLVSNMIDGDYGWAVIDAVLFVGNVGMFTLFLGDK